MLAMHDFVVGQRQQEVLGEGVHHAERQFVLMMLAMDGIAAHITQRVVHPAHVPFHTEAQPPGVDGSRDAAPGRGLFGDGQHTRIFLVQDRVHVLEELNRFEVFSPAEHVRHPLAVLARVVEVQHRRDRVDAQSVDVVDIQPEPRAGDEEVADFPASIVEDQRAPIRMESLARIRVLVAAGSIEGPQRVPIRGKVRRNPVDDDADSRLMALIDELHEVVRSSEAAGHREVTGGLITPRAVKRKLVDRHQLDVRVSEFLHVLDQSRRDLAIVEVLPAVSRAFPRSQMHFINRYRLLVPVHGFPVSDPGSVPPVVAAEIVNDRGALGRDFRGKGVGINLLQQIAIAGAHGELVGIAMLQAGNESPPDAAVARIQGIAAMHPRVLVAQNSDLRGIRRPDMKCHAGNAITGVQVCAQVAIQRRFHP